MGGGGGFIVATICKVAQELTLRPTGFRSCVGALGVRRASTELVYKRCPGERPGWPVVSAEYRHLRWAKDRLRSSVDCGTLWSLPGWRLPAERLYGRAQGGDVDPGMA